MAIFGRDRNSDESVGTTPDLRQQLESMSAEQKRVLSQGAQTSVRANALSPSPEAPLSFSFRASTRAPEPPPAVALAALPVAPRPARISADVVPLGDATPGLACDAKEPNDLIIKRGVTLKGELSSCERLVIQGHVEASVTDCGKLEVLAGGMFKGSARFRDADIAGDLEGVLMVEGTLFVRATGRISGTVHYGRLAVQEGAVLRATFEVISSVEESDENVDSSAPSLTSEAAAE